MSQPSTLSQYGGYGGGYDPYSSAARPENIMEHLQLLRWYTEGKLAEHRLFLIAKHIDDPQWIADKEEEWLHEPKYWNGYYGRESFPKDF